MFLSEEEDVMDITGDQLKDISSLSLPETLIELDLTTNRLATVDPRIGQLTKLQKLSFRQNLLTDSAASELSTFSGLTSLQELVLRDNLLKSVPPVTPLLGLRVFDVSYNEIPSMAGVASAPAALRELYLSSNLVGKIEELDKFSELRLLELGSNKIRIMEGLEALTSLQELWLGRNKIRETNLCGLTQLLKISVQSNRLTSMRGFEACLNLEELYLSNNGISKIEGLAPLTKLKILDLAANQIAEISGLDSLTRLEDLWLNDNLITSFENLDKVLKGPKDTLVTVYFERNPAARNNGYITRLKALLPKVEQIDAVDV